MDTGNEFADEAKIFESISSDKHATQEEFDNFMHRVTDVEKIVKKLASSDIKEQEEGKLLADQILEGNSEKEFTGDGEVRIKTNRTVINKSSTNNDSTSNSKDAFMRSVEWDAKQRADDRKMRNERAETYKRIGNGAFKEGDYEKALTYFTRAIEFRKDSTVLWNNRALTLMKLKKYRKAIDDCEWTLKICNSNIKALLNIAKCHALLHEHEKSNEFLQIARERNSNFTDFINDFEKELKKLEEEVKPKRNYDQGASNN